MLQDAFGRSITYLRISVTDKCNYRCRYCMPKEGITLKSHRKILRFEEIEKIVAVAAHLGISKIRFTGGEPLVRKEVETVVALCSAISGIEEICMTTNGSLLTQEKVLLLKKSGLTRINISLDTLDPQKFSYLTRGGDIGAVLKGIDAAIASNLMPIKINMVLFENTPEGEIGNMREFCKRRGLLLQTINHFSLKSKNNRSHFYAQRPPLCQYCNRLRITADGYLKSCLFSDSEIKINMNDIENAFLQAVVEKPQNGISCLKREMSQIGG